MERYDLKAQLEELVREMKSIEFHTQWDNEVDERKMKNIPYMKNERRKREIKERTKQRQR